MLKSLKNDKLILKKTSNFRGYFFQSQRGIHIIEGLHKGECHKKMVEVLYTDTSERRDKIQIYADIIQITKTPKKMTRILRLANIQFNSFQESIDILCESNLLEKILLKYANKNVADNRVKYKYKATKMGLDWIKQVNEIYKTIE